MVAGKIGISGNAKSVGDAMLQLDPVILRVELAFRLAAPVGYPQLGLGLALAEQLGAVGIAEILFVGRCRSCSQPCQANA